MVSASMATIQAHERILVPRGIRCTLEGRGQLGKSIKELLNHWSETKASWKDANADRFEKKHLVPLEMDLRQANVPRGTRNTSCRIAGASQIGWNIAARTAFFFSGATP